MAKNVGGVLKRGGISGFGAAALSGVVVDAMRVWFRQDGLTLQQEYAFQLESNLDLIDGGGGGIAVEIWTQTATGGAARGVETIGDTIRALVSLMFTYGMLTHTFGWAPAGDQTWTNAATQ